VAVTTVHLVRHGQTQWNLDGRIQGQTGDIPLTALGRRQAEAAARTLADRPIAAVWSSDLLRAVQTAQPIAAAVGLPVQLDRGLREQAYGILEGRCTADVLADTPYDLTDPDVRAPGGETMREVYQRIGDTLAERLRENPGQEIVLVSHADAIRIALAWLAGSEIQHVRWHELPHGSITTVPTPVQPRPIRPCGTWRTCRSH
jgi:broad specificity phosphatase PhoE